MKSTTTNASVAINKALKTNKSYNLVKTNQKHNIPQVKNHLLVKNKKIINSNTSKNNNSSKTISTTYTSGSNLDNDNKIMPVVEEGLSNDDDEDDDEYYEDYEDDDDEEDDDQEDEEEEEEEENEKEFYKVNEKFKTVNYQNKSIKQEEYECNDEECQDCYNNNSNNNSDIIRNKQLFLNRQREIKSNKSKLGNTSIYTSSSASSSSSTIKSVGPTNQQAHIDPFLNAVNKSKIVNKIGNLYKI
jgi:hypothetical protein